jgi:hypothetical protein
MTRLLSSALLLLAGTLVGCSDGICDAAELTDALAAAGLNDTVTVGSCEVRGSFTVPSAVTLAGTDSESRLVASGGPAVILAGGREAATLRDLSISSAEPSGVLADGVGGVAIRNVRIDASKGVALRLESVGLATLSDVTLTGPVTSAVAASLTPTPDSAVIATHGLVIVDSSAVTLERVNISGFARFGALALNSTVTWTGGGASDTLGVGFMAEGGSATVRDAQFCRVFAGLRPYPAYGLVFTGSASSTTERVTLCENEGYGMLQNGGLAVHTDLVGAANREPAVWVQQSSDFSLSGTGTLLSDNALAGIVVVDSTNVRISDAEIDASSLATRIVAVGGSVRVGDGVHLVVGNAGDVSLTNVTLLNNARAGLLLDFAAGTPDAMNLASVTVDGTGDALGAIAQSGTDLMPSGTWDRNITRRGATVVNDSALAGRLDVVGIVGPMFLPPSTP